MGGGEDYGEQEKEDTERMLKKVFGTSHGWASWDELGGKPGGQICGNDGEEPVYASGGRDSAEGEGFEIGDSERRSVFSG